MSVSDGNTPGGDGRRPAAETRQITVSSNLTPEQGCLGCALGLLAVLLAALFWGFFFWRMGQREQRPSSARPAVVAARWQYPEMRNEL